MALALLAGTLHACGALAQEREGSKGEAGGHFRHGVELYGEADYAGALVEFKRAYTLAPSSAALYDVGEAQYQLQDYAAALTTFQRFLGEFGPNESHRAEVERAVDVLRTRVGHISITTLPLGADVTVDDQAVGRSPFGEPLLVSIGHRKLAASMAGRYPVTSYVDVAAGDNVSVSLQLPASLQLPTAEVTQQLAGAAPARSTESPAAPQPRSSTLRAAGFVAAGVLAAGAVTFGVLAIEESSALTKARATFPPVGATIHHDASLTTTYAILADSFGAAAIAVGGVALYSVLSAPTAGGYRTGGSVPAARVTLGAASARFEMTF
jgi:hypothetical protein